MMFTALSIHKQVWNRVFGDATSLYKTLNPQNPLQIGSTLM